MIKIIPRYTTENFFYDRDVAGERPAYWYKDDDKSIVSSSIREMLPHIPVVEPGLAIGFDALECATSGPDTLFKDIHNLLPGYKFSYTRDGTRAEAYWNIRRHRASRPYCGLNHLDSLLRASIAARIPSGKPWGMYLSGGIDSGIIAAIAKPDICFTCNFPDGPRYDELEYAQAIADYIGTELIVIQPTQEDFERDFDDIIYNLEMPVASFSAFPLYSLARAASERGIEVILSGEGADELFSGYTRHLILAHEQSLYDAPAMQNYAPLLDYYLGSPLDRYARLITRRPGWEDTVQSIIAYYFNQFNDVIHAMGYTELKVLLPTILHMSHQMSSAFGVENRSPFLDKSIIEYAFSIPSHLKIRDGETKWIIRELAKQYLPEFVTERPGKMGLVFPYGRWYPSTGTRGEFDRSGYQEDCYSRWHRIYFEEQRWKNQYSGGHK